MTRLSDALSQAISDSRLSTSELETLLDAGTTSAGTATAELKDVLTRYHDALEPAAAELLQERERTLGVKLEGPPDLRSAAPLKEVWSGNKLLSASSNSRDPGVVFVQRALLRIAVMENSAAFGLPKFGADGALGAETTAAIRAFQRSAGVKEDGIVGKDTLRMLELALKGRISELQSARFRDNTELDAVLDGRSPALAKGAKGEAVKIVQNVLIDLGYPLPKFGADSQLGAETVKAITQFQADHGLPQNGRVDSATLQALDKVAPAPGQNAVLKPEYERMLRNGVLTVTIGVGFDETSADLSERAEVQDGLRRRGFKVLKVANMSDKELLKLGVEPSLVDRSARYYFKTTQFAGTSRPVLVKYVDRDSPNPAQQFAAGFAADGLVMYAGHARYGSGPDFDVKESMAGNFVVGVPYDAHMKEIIGNHGNDLAATRMTDQYQMMFFSGCKTNDYLDDLRSLPKNKSEDTLDTVTSNDLLYWNNMSENLFTMFDGVLAEKSANAVRDDLFAINQVPFTLDGFGGNLA